MMQSLLMALGLVFVIEGLLYALVPGQLKAMLMAMKDASDDQLRLGGVVAIALGVVIVWVVKSVSG